MASFHESYSLYILENYQKELEAKFPLPLPLPQSADVFSTASDSDSAVQAELFDVEPKKAFKVGIIGAGVAGLYAAMILQSFGIEYEILEAQPDHIGGRLLTHHFSDGPNDYYDIGAMRFPNIRPMWRTFDLFYRLRFTGKYIYEKSKLEELDRDVQDKTKKETNNVYDSLVTDVTFDEQSSTCTSDVIDYRFNTPEDIQNFNGVSVRRKNIRQKDDQFHVGDTIPQSYLIQGVQVWLDAKIGYFKEALKKDFKSGMEELKKYDYNSTRQFMRSLHPELTDKFAEYMKIHHPDTPYAGERDYPDEVINWIETFSSGTSMYDSALTETVMEELDFNYAPKVSWKAIQGGANRIAQAMAKQLREAEEPKGQIVQSKRVLKISPDTRPGNQLSQQMLVHVEGEATPRVYDHVLSTVALSALRMIDLDECKLSWQLRESLRSLQYGASVKIGIRFTHRWWETKGQDHLGGVSTTDRLSRMIVYPSYGIGTKDATMLVSYSWSQDALRLGTFVKGKGSLAEQRLVDLILRDLSKVHDIAYEDLKSWQVDHHAYNWYDNEFTVGAFAFFGPAQFRKMYQEVTQPAGMMHLHFAGEATSTNHAWVVGALDSSVRALTQIFYQEDREDLVKRLKDEWDLVTEMSLDMAKLQLALNQDAGKTYGSVSGNN